jgi:hypothetical protein
MLVEDLLITSIDEMVVRAAKRFVEHHLLLEGLPPSMRREQLKEQERRREVIDRLVILRKAMTSERAPGSPGPTFANTRKRSRREFMPHGQGGVVV